MALPYPSCQATDCTNHATPALTRRYEFPIGNELCEDISRGSLLGKVPAPKREAQEEAAAVFLPGLAVTG